MDKKKKKKIRALSARIEALAMRARKAEEAQREWIERVHPSFVRSAVNLIHYRSLREEDISDLQKGLGNLGLSRLAKAEAHVMASLRSNLAFLECLSKGTAVRNYQSGLSVKKSRRIHKKNAKALLGYRSKGRRARIMVTLPAEAAGNYQLVHDLVEAGMNCARINCAHDGPETWKQMIDHVRKASGKLGRQVKVAMDLGGPKIRTGAIRTGPKVRKYRPVKDVRGRIPQPLEAWLGVEPAAGLPHVPVSAEHLKKLSAGETLFLRDTREKKRTIRLMEAQAGGFLAQIDRTTFLETNLLLFKDPKMQGPFVQVGELPPVEQVIILQKDDLLRIHRSTEPGEPAPYDDNGIQLAMAHISCTSEEVFGQVAAGEPILFDDGKIEGRIREANDNEMIVQISRVPVNGGKLRADKGINLPASDLKINGLTTKDRRDLEFVAVQADVVNVSFVNRPEDIRELIAELDRLDARDRLGIILKIETQKGFNNLTEILLEAMQLYPLGVMIARGDLAIETGWQNIGRVQEEILLLCRAAHIPDIWATQVLENLAKRGIPSRAEITDAAMAQRADCVMLNKGPYILQAIRLLDTILKDLAPYQDKNAPMLPAWRKAGFETG